MIDGGADIARLGLDLDGRDFVRTGEEAIAALVRLGEAGEAVRAELKRIEEAQREAARAASEAASADERLARTIEDGLAERAASEEREAQARTQRRDQEIQAAVAAEEERFRAAADVAQRAQEERRSREAAEAEASVAEAARAGQDQALAQVVAMQATFASEMARVKEAVARGLLTPEEARQAALAAGEAYNEELLRVIASVRDAGGFDADGGAEVYATLVGSLQNLDEGGQRAAVGLGRLNQALTSNLRQVAGLNPAVAQLVNTIGGMALGGAVMTGVLAAGAALSLMFNRWREDARRAREEQEDATRVLEGIRKAAEAPWEEASGAVRAYQRRVEEARVELERLQAAVERAEAGSARAPVQGSSLVGAQPLAAAGRFRERGAAEEIAEQERLIEAGERRITEIQERARADRLSRLVSANQATAREREEAVRFAEDLERRLAQAMSDDSREGQEERVRLIGLLGGLASALERRAEATDRAAEASRRFMADLRLQVEEEERLLEASRMGAQAMDAEAQAIERENAIRAAGAQAMAGQREEAERLAAAIHDLRVEREAEVRAQALASEMQRSDEDLAQMQALLELTREHTGTSEELAAAQRELAEAFEDRRRVEEMVAAGWDPDAARARVEAERETRDAIDGISEARRRQERSEEFLRGRRRELDDMQRLIALHDELAGETEQLEAAVAAYNRELAERAMIEAAIRQGFDGDIESLRAFVSEYLDAQDRLRGLGDAGVEAANRTQQAFSAALGAISTGVGGLAGELASIGQAFLAGGPVGGIGAIAGSLLSRAFGGGGREEAAREQARMAEEARRAADALAEFTRRLDDDMRIRGLRLSGDDLGTDLERLRQSQRDELQAQLDRFVERFGEGRSPQGLIDELFGRPGADGRTNDELRALVEGARGNITDEAANAILQWLDLLDLQAREMQAIYERHAAREEAEAERRRAALTGFEDDMARLSLLLGDDERALRMFDLEAAFERQMKAYRELEREGIITAEQLDEMARLLRDQVNVALEEFDDAARRAAEASREAARAERERAEEAAMAERLRQATDEERLRIQLLRAQGFEEEARAAANALELEIAMREGRSANYLIMLQQLRAQEDLNAAQQQAASSADAASRAMGRMAGTLNASPLFNATWARTTVTGRMARSASAASAAPVVQRFDVTIQGADKSASQLFREMQREADRIRRRGGGDPWDSVEA